MVAIAEGFMIDLTTYQFNYQECSTLPGMIVCPIVESAPAVLGIEPLARLAGKAFGHVYNAVWLPTPQNIGWLDDAASQAVRRFVLDRLIFIQAGFSAKPKMA